ncbi:hypothetical protein C8R43DRAFT_1016273 [Mycena crocata]|nr:hypothetical protein C8R43DRAFT_1016273 [Mycena crocata]
MNVDTTPNEPQRFEELWFEDGNVVVQAGNRQFRVFRGILAARSPVFKDMFSFPQPTDSETVDVCPLVRFTDSAEDVTVFLKAIFEPSFFLPFPAPTDFDAITGCLRLGQKYQVDYLRSRALIHLTSRYPMSLSAFDQFAWQENDRIPLDCRICVMQLCRELDCPWILPFAFYYFAIHFLDVSEVIFEEILYRGNPTGLSERDQHLFLVGHHRQSHKTVSRILQFFLDPLAVDGCTSPAQCISGRIDAYTSALKVMETDPNSPLDFWNQYDWISLESAHTICPACLESLKISHQGARQKLWDEIPGIYGLPSWSELEGLRDAAIGDGL